MDDKRKKVAQRLKDLENNSHIYDMFRLAVNKDLTQKWNNVERIKSYISNEINDILKEIYLPLGYWTQNPLTNKEKDDLGVVINSIWSFLNQLNTNYSAHEYIFNKINFLILRESTRYAIDIDNIKYDKNNLFKFNYYWNSDRTIEELKKIFSVIRYFKYYFFVEEGEFYDGLKDICNTTMGLGDTSQKVVEDNIDKLFDNIKSFVASTGLGDYKDRVQGVDIWVTLKSNKEITLQIKRCPIPELIGDEYFINISLSRSNRANYFVFVYDNDKKIAVFRNTKSVKPFESGILLPEKDLYKIIDVNNN